MNGSRASRARRTLQALPEVMGGLLRPLERMLGRGRVLRSRIDDRTWLELQLRPDEARARYGIPLPQLPPDDVQVSFTARCGRANLQQAFNFYQYVGAVCRLGRVREPRILDFGAGWGRISRFFLRDTKPERIVVADCMSEAIRWLRATGNPCHIIQNEPRPPISGLRGPFDLIYAFSVFSHLSEGYFHAWMAYLMALLRPGGYLAFTTMGHQFIDHLERLHRDPAPAHQGLGEHQRILREQLPPPQEVRQRYRDGEFQFYPIGGAGELTPDFFGEAFIPQSYIEKHYGSALVQFTEEVPELDQSVVILQRRPVGLTASLWQTAWPREHWRRLRSTPDERRRPEERSVLRTLLPRRLRLYARGEFRRLLRGALPEVLPGCLQGLEPRIAQGGGQPSQEPGLLSEGFFPHCPGSRSYFVPKTSERMEGATSRFPVPPQEFWLGWPTAEAYLDSGKQHVETMRQVLEQSGQPVELARCILEFGCAAGRLIRWLHDMADAREIWGLDIHAPQVMWCRQNLSPPFNFATTTIYPHLPFEDRYFDFAFAASVFTHIDDLAPAWFLELRRVLRPGGKLYVTVHDRNTVAILDRADHWLSRQLQSVPEYKQYAHAEFGMFTIGRSVHSQVFYDPAFLSRSLEPFFRTLSVTPNAYGYQTAVLLERV